MCNKAHDYNGESQMSYKINERLEYVEQLLQAKCVSKWMGIKEVSIYSSLSPSTIRRAVLRGSLKVSKSTGKLLFQVGDVDRWLRNG